MPNDPKFNKVRGELNIVLNKEQLNQILTSVLGPKGKNLGNVAIASDHCCVDASVGSSVAGPVSSVASSVSVPAPEGRLAAGNSVSINSKKLAQKISEKNLNLNVQVPSNTVIK